jgi:hypothetical protein
MAWPQKKEATESKELKDTKFSSEMNIVTPKKKQKWNLQVKLFAGILCLPCEVFLAETVPGEPLPVF